jgi:hypothetical protein
MISTLRDFIQATGGELCVVARYPTYACEVLIPVMDHEEATRKAARDFRVVWQNPSTRRLVQVGILHYDGTGFTFSYTPEAHLDPDFVPFAPFSDLHRVYRASSLFPFFADRLATSALGGVEMLAAALGLEAKEATPVELLARSWGHTLHDRVQVVPDPVEAPDGSEVMLFLASGVRHAPPNPKRASARVARLREGEDLELRDEPDNPESDRAIVLDAATGQVGWVPDYLLDYVHKRRDEGRSVTATVVHANGQDVPWHLRLLCRLDVGPPPGG